MFRGCLLFLLLTQSCGEFNVSPYISKTADSKTNTKQLSLISQNESTAGTSYKIAVLSDTHNYYKELEDQVEYINARKNEYEFVIVSGDITNLGLLREYEMTKRLLEKLSIPYVVAAGNHDLLSNGESIYDQMFGSSNFAFTYKQTKFIVYNNNNWEATGRIPDLGFVEGQLASSSSSNNIIISHVSPEDSDRWDEAQVNEVRNLVSSYGVDYYLNGHDHNPTCSDFSGATRCTVGASVKGKILELNLSNSGVSHQFVEF